MIVAEDVVFGGNANAAGQNVVDASRNRTRCNILVPNAVATFRWADPFG